MNPRLKIAADAATVLLLSAALAWSGGVANALTPTVGAQSPPVGDMSPPVGDMSVPVAG